MENLTVTLIVAILMLGLGSCTDNPVEQYGDKMVQSYDAGKTAGEVADLSAIRTTIAAYYASNERYPASLEEISRLLRKDLDPARYSYNPESGTVVIK